MKRTITKLLSTILTISMVLGMCGITAMAGTDASATGNVERRFTETTVDATTGIYKLVYEVRATEHDHVDGFTSIFSFDNTDVQPVHKTKHTDLDVTKGGVNTSNAFVFYTFEDTEFVFTAAKRAGMTSSDRTAVNIEYYVANGVYDEDELDGKCLPKDEWTFMWEFYYKYKDGATIDDKTWRIETDYTEAFLPEYCANEDLASPFKLDAKYFVGGPADDGLGKFTSFSYQGIDLYAPAAPKVDSFTVASGLANAKVYYNAAVSGTAIIAVYDENNTMIGSNIGSITTSTTEIDISAEYDGVAKTVKVFVWDSYGTDNKPVTTAKVYTVS